MKRWAALLSLSLLVLIAFLVIQHARRDHEKKKREAEYQSILRQYSEALKPGTTRQDVETYLGVNKQKFSRFPADESGAYADIVRIGEEDAPWYCSKYSVYIAFHFAADTLKKVSLYPKLEDCL